MGNFSCCTVKPKFAFEPQSEIVQYRIRIEGDVFWTGTSATNFRDQIPIALNKYVEKILVSLSGGKPGIISLEQFYGSPAPESERKGIISLERFYGPLIPESERKESMDPTKNCDIYQIDYQSYMYQGYRMICMLSAGQVKNGHIHKFILCYEPKARSPEELNQAVLTYLSEKEF
ncbi:Hypothetical protein HVR_LOCUS1266 [uncultured virus]|nr:Hypothetical protein HVR_LOCUS1266 [uncultured virus]